MKIRGADVYAGSLLPHLRPDMLAGRSLNDAYGAILVIR